MKLPKNQCNFTNNKLSTSDQLLWNSYTSWLFSTNSYVIHRRSTKIIPDKTVLDLHGYTIQDAFDKTIEFLNNHRKNKTKKVIIICGKSGQISKELKYWCLRLSFVRDISPNIDNSNGVGSYTITFSKH